MEGRPSTVGGSFRTTLGVDSTRLLQGPKRFMEQHLVFRYVDFVAIGANSFRVILSALGGSLGTEERDFMCRHSTQREDFENVVVKVDST